LFLATQLGDKMRVAHALRNLGHLALDKNDREEAAGLYRQALSITYELESKQNVALCLVAMSGLALAGEQPRRSARLLGAANKLRDESRGLLPLTDRVVYERTMVALHSTIDEQTLLEVWKHGSSWSMQEVVGYAQEKSLYDD
jgi:hypothetical protein